MVFILNDRVQSLCVHLSRLRISLVTAAEAPQIARLGVDTKEEKAYKYPE